MTIPRGISKHQIHYFGGVCWFACDRKTFEKAYKYLHGEDYPENTEDAAGLTCEDPVFKDGTHIFLVGVFDKNQSTILHETTHLSLFILKRASINPMDDRGENLAYIIEHFVVEFSKKVFAVKNKSKILPIDYVEGREW